MTRKPLGLVLLALASALALAMTAGCNGSGSGDADADADLDTDGDGDGHLDAGPDGDGDIDADGDSDGDSDDDLDADPDGDGDSEPAVCLGISCGEHARCVEASSGGPLCLCEEGYHLESGRCLVTTPGGPCDGKDCGPHGTCSVLFRILTQCECELGYTDYAGLCVDERRVGCRAEDGSLVSRGTRRCDPTDTFLEVCHDGDGDGLSEWVFGVECVSTPCSTSCVDATCDVQPCPVGTSCVAESHGEPLNACVVSCDCSNCGNCDMEDFVESGATGAQCGNPDGSVPSLACDLPCPSPGTGCIPYDPQICWAMEGCMSAPPGSG